MINSKMGTPSLGWIESVILVTICLLIGSSRADLQDEAAVNDTKAMAQLESVLIQSEPRVRPNVYGEPVVVRCDFYIQSLGPINEIDMDYSMEIFFRLRWVDGRLSFSESQPPLQVPAQELQKFWLPDIYFPNEKLGRTHDVTAPNKAITIYPNGTVLHSTRLTLKLECNMFLMAFPLDYQKCVIKISSYSYDSSQLSLIWSDDKEAVHIKKSEFSLPQFELLKIEKDNCVLAYKPGDYTCLIAMFHLKRQIGFYVLQTYIPSILIVMLSWVSFWISKDAVPARISLGVTTVLTMTTQLSSSRSNSMRVSYPKAIDVWYASCMMFVFGALLEYALVNVMSRSKDIRHHPRPPHFGNPGSKRNNKSERVDSEAHLASHNDIEMQSTQKINYDGDIVQDNNDKAPPRSSSVYNYYQRFLDFFANITVKDIDHLCRKVFPGAFAIFNLIYWTVYTQPSLFEQ